MPHQGVRAGACDAQEIERLGSGGGRVIVKKANFAVALFLLLSLPFFVLVARPVLHGVLDFQFYMDSPTYHAAADQMDVGRSLIAISSNLFGPVVIIKALGGSYTLIYLFNGGLFVLTYLLVIRSFPVDRLRFVIVMCAAPLTFTSLFSVNKEIVAVFVSLLFAASYAKNRPAWRWIAIGVAILARWQMVVALLIAAVLLGALNPLRRHRLPTLICLLAAISVVYPLLGLGVLEEVSAVADNRLDFQGSGLFPLFIQIQNHVGGYLLVFVPKALHLFVGMVRRSDHLFEPEDVMNNTILWFQSVAQLTVLSFVLFTRRLRLSSDVVYLAVLIAAVITLSPIFSTRYLLPVYALFAVSLAMPKRADQLESA